MGEYLRKPQHTVYTIKLQTERTETLNVLVCSSVVQIRVQSICAFRIYLKHIKGVVDVLLVTKLIVFGPTHFTLDQV